MPSSRVRAPVRRHYIVAGILAAVILSAVALTAVVRSVRADETTSQAGEDATGQASADATTEPSDDPVTSSPPPPREDSSPAPLPPPPVEGACRRLPVTAVARAVDDTARSSCREPHTARTIAVGALDARTLDRSGADAAAVADQAGDQCDRAFSAYVGGDTEDRRLTRLQPVWFTAGERAIAAGSLWVRCDVVAYETDERLATLPPDLKGVLDGNGGTQLGLCSTIAPQAERARNVMCSEPHTWRAFSVIPLQDGRWPGVPAVRKAGEDRCSRQARIFQGNPDDWRYGWQWPTQKQWEAGRSYGYCWVPD